MRPLVIFGAGEIAQVVDHMFRETLGRGVAAFTVDRAYATGEEAFGRPLVPFDEVAARFPPATHDGFVALSYARMNVVRADKAAAMRGLGYALTSYVSPRATVMTDRIGDNCLILEDNTLQPFSVIGDNVTLWSGNHVGHHAVIEDNVFLSSHVVVSGGVTVGRNSFVGVNATLVDHITIAPFTLVGAGCVITESTDAEGVYMPPAPAEKRKVPSTRLKRF